MECPLELQFILERRKRNKMLQYDDKENLIKIEQVSIILGKNYVISFQELNGMKFKFMPELERRGAYYVVWGVIVGIAGSMLIYFKRKKRL